MKIQNSKPMWLSAPTIKDYDEWVIEAARVDGWNDAMEHIFGARIRKCWVHDTEGDWICANCQNRERCLVYGK